MISPMLEFQQGTAAFVSPWKSGYGDADPGPRSPPKELSMTHDPRFGPDPDALYPIPGLEQVMFIKNLDLPPNVEVGAYTYYDDPAGPDTFLRNILYHFEFTGDRLKPSQLELMAAFPKFMPIPMKG
jgi:hypothetical protein